KIANTGTLSIAASYKPLIKCVAPGPPDPTVTPSLPLNFHCITAAIAPTSSCLTCNHLTLFSGSPMAFMNPLKVPDGTPYTVGTPQPSITFKAANPAVILFSDI